MPFLTDAFGNFMSVLTQVLVLFIFIIAGAVLQKTGLAKPDGVAMIINILFYVVTPCVIIKAFMSTSFSGENMARLGMAAGIAVGYHLAAVLVCGLLFRREPPERRGIFRFASVFPNCGFFSLPLAEALLGPPGVFLVSVFIAVFHVFVWTWGCSQFNAKMQISRLFLNPGVIGIVLGFPFFFLSGDRLPQLVTAPLSGFAALNSPLAMLVVGYYLAQTRLTLQKGDANLLFSQLLRLVFLPSAALVLLVFTGVRGDTLLACMIPVCAPSALNVVMFASKFKGDVLLATRAATFGTVVSIIFVPVFISAAALLI